MGILSRADFFLCILSGNRWRGKVARGFFLLSIFEDCWVGRWDTQGLEQAWK